MQRPRPDKSKWNIVLTGPVQRVTTADGHDVVARTSNFNTYLVADTTSPATVEANFKNIGSNRSPNGVVDSTGATFFFT